VKPAPFEYHRPTTIAEALDLLAGHPDAAVMAGNQSLGIVMGNRLATPDHVVDINRVDDLAFVDVGEDEVAVGATARHRDLERSSALRATVPMLPEAAAQIAGPSVRSRGTVGGSICEADPAGNYPTAAVALDADLRLVSAGGERTVAARDFFLGFMMTDLGEAELVERVTVDRGPFPAGRTGMAFLELKPAAQTWPTISAAAAVRVDDPTAPAPVVEEARLALANAADVPLHVPDAESAVVGEPLSEAGLDAVAAAAAEASDPSDELHADAEFKREVAAEYARRSIETAYDRATGAE